MNCEASMAIKIAQPRKIRSLLVLPVVFGAVRAIGSENSVSAQRA
jgi:hypothetical protein